MAEFMNDEQIVVSVGMPIIFENKTDASFEVRTGIVFRKSGVYEVSIVGNKTIVSKVAGLGTLKDLTSAQTEQQMQCGGCRYDNHASGWSDHCVLCRRNYLDFKDRYER